ncbi:inositol monophosphatase family protein [Amnibacterium sp. CER49]|nr:inositol monophosphatase family protein [Amnibacterium sp. CER49]MDH2445264.1 inositol monophosphatase family protein [Amnibacterium sp. CER49]
MAQVLSMQRFRAADLRVTTKPDRTPVTDADQAIEQALRAALADQRPDDAVLGEEYGGDPAPGRQWIIDPIDGTTNFLRGLPIWATLIALAVDGEPVLGVAAAPALGRRWWAARGQGAWAAPVGEGGTGAPARLQVSGVAELADALLSYNSLQGWDDAGALEGLLALSRASWRTRALGDFWSYVLVAEGQVDVVGEHDLKVYDLAALEPIVTEAGGRFTALDGRPGPWHGTALATNGLLHDAALGKIAPHISGGSAVDEM